MKLVTVYSAAGLLEADMIKAFLEAQGIQVVLSQESLGRTMGLSAGMLGKVDVMVPESQVEETKTLLTAIDDGEYENFNIDQDSEPTDNEDDNDDWAA